MTDPRPEANSNAPNDGEVAPFAAYNGSESFVFVSYSHVDRAVVFQDLRRLRTAGFNIWYDEGIAPGSEWTDELAAAITGCERVLFYVSAASSNSRVCRDEIRFANQHHKSVLAVHLAPIEPTSGLDTEIASPRTLLRYEFSDAAYARELVRALRSPLDEGQRFDKTARRPSRPYRRFAVFAVAFLAALIAGAYVFVDTGKPRVTAYTQLTRAGDRFAPEVSPYAITTDGPRVYFVTWKNDGVLDLRSVLMRGGQSTSLNSPLTGFIVGITPDYGELVVASRNAQTGKDERWLWPPSGGTPRRLDVNAHDVAWSNDGTLMVFGTMEINVAKADGSDRRKIVDSPGVVAWIRVSPDNRRIRFTAREDGVSFATLWEVSMDGTNLHRLFGDWNDPPNECCGSWTRDGKYYVFQAKRGGHWQLWAARDGGWLPGASEPVELTPRAMEFVWPTISADGRKIVAMGWQLGGEVMRFDVATKQWVPHSTSPSGEWLAYSPDQAWIAYVSYPGAELWRSRPDGSEACLLAPASARPVAPLWSPDGRTVSFTDTKHGRVMLVATDCRSPPRLLARSERRECCATWSPDARRLAVWTQADIRLVDADTGAESQLPGSESLWQPSWWADGRYISAASRADGLIKRFDFETSAWTTLGQVEHPFAQRPSPDGQYLWIVSEGQDGDPSFLGMSRHMSRMRVSDGRVEPVASLSKDQPWVWGTVGPWMGIAPDGSPLYLRDLGVYQIYALDWET